MKKSWIFDVLGIVVKLVCEILIFYGFLKFFVDRMPEMYTILLEKDKVDESLAAACIVVFARTSLLLMYRIYDQINEIFKIETDGDRYDTNDQKTRSSSNELTHEHHA